MPGCIFLRPLLFTDAARDFEAPHGRASHFTDQRGGGVGRGRAATETEKHRGMIWSETEQTGTWSFQIDTLTFLRCKKQICTEEKVKNIGCEDSFFVIRLHS